MGGSQGRLAYIQVEGVDKIFIDIIRFSRTGNSLIYKNKRYIRTGFMLRDGIADDGEKIRVYSLSREYSPGFEGIPVIEVTQAALPYYRRWIDGVSVWR